MSYSSPNRLAHPSLKTKSAQERLLWICILLMALVTVFRLIKLGIEDGNDFSVFYSAAQRYLQGQNPYIQRGDPLRLEEALKLGAAKIEVVAYGNPPLTTTTLAAFCWLDIRSAQAAFTLFSLSVFLVGFWAALAVFVPHWSKKGRLLLLVLLLQSVSVRWIVGQLQTTLLVMGALGLFLYADSRRSLRMMFWSGVLASLKPTLFLPVLVLLAFRRKYRLLALMLLTIGLLNVLAALPGGFRATIAGYRLSLANFSAPGSNNYPDVHESLSPYQGRKPLAMQAVPGTAYPEANGYIGEQLNWTYLFSGLTPNLKDAGRVALLCNLLSLGALGWLWGRTKNLHEDDKLGHLLFCLAMTLSLLCVYHQRYDAALLLYTLVFVIGEKPRLFRGISILIAVLCAFVAILYVNFLWAKWLTFTSHGNREWLVPLRAYASSGLLLLQFWQIRQYLRQSGRAALEDKFSPGG